MKVYKCELHALTFIDTKDLTVAEKKPCRDF